MTLVTGAALLLGGLLGEGRERSNDLGPAPIGSDPWLLTEVRAALGRERGLDVSSLVVNVAEAVVTVRGARPDDVERVERAARTVQGIKTLHVERAP